MKWRMGNFKQINVRFSFFFKDSVDSQERRVHQVSKGNLDDQDPRVTLDTQEYLDFQVMPKFKN